VVKPRRTDFDPSTGQDGLKSVLRLESSVPGGVGQKPPHRELLPLSMREVITQNIVSTRRLRGKWPAEKRIGV
jgi:hypothetical protein